MLADEGFAGDGRPMYGTLGNQHCYPDQVTLAKARQGIGRQGMMMPHGSLSTYLGSALAWPACLPCSALSCPASGHAWGPSCRWCCSALAHSMQHHPTRTRSELDGAWREREGGEWRDGEQQSEPVARGSVARCSSACSGSCSFQGPSQVLTLHCKCRCKCSRPQVVCRGPGGGGEGLGIARH